MKSLLKTLSFGAAAVIVTVLVVATILENLFGSPFAIENIYHSPWFIALWALLAVTATAYILRTQRRVSLILLHASFVVVLLGAFVSFLTSKRGDMAISQGGVPASMFETSDGTLQKMPFRMQLADVDTKYSDNGTVSGYSVSIMADGILHTLSLNTPVKINGYQFCIKGVDEEGVSLLVAYDPYGRPISYLGYAMVFLSFLMLFFDRQSGFKALLQQVKGESGNVKVAGKREQRKSLLLLCRAGAGSSARSAVKAENGKRKARFALAFCSECSRGSSTRSVVKGESGKLVSTSFYLLVLSVFLCILWYGRGVFSAASGAEALLLLAVVLTLLAVVLRRVGQFVLLSRLLVVVAAMFFVVAALGLDGDSDVQPILRTPLLSIHVTTIIIAYALLACTAVNAVIALCRKDAKKGAQQALLGRLLLYPATMLLATGIFIGAVWANLSWGRYWGWDPKEVWALITLLVCSMGFHSHSLRFISKPVAFHIFCIVAFLAVLFTYFGVSYLLGGLHSYA
jgi:ABC-type transport system involved in cytochrome c biogenesis permease subunit